ncbi:hypothetical protein RFI_23569 [Reticulomyxa filosa]|uniref:Uncharacterized protein n=1 Tax=Reticulomyxa filosa TaxID=46433 RepID=X6ML59_RETFI|nr:hypothetical protein RFI_23569 [Reticulomyxa filosa]|eukprot:ETO13800.1 hypothetical protein RFI_23569 [Reticulomyxa filosa]
MQNLQSQSIKSTPTVKQYKQKKKYNDILQKKNQKNLEHNKIGGKKHNKVNLEKKIFNIFLITKAKGERKCISKSNKDSQKKEKKSLFIATSNELKKTNTKKKITNKQTNEKKHKQINKI